MLGNNNNELDPISFWILILLSGGQRLSVLDLVQILGRAAENIWNSILILRGRGFINDTRGRFWITNEGAQFLAFRGISATTPEDEPVQNDFVRRIHPPFFSSFRELFMWAAAPLIILIPTLIMLSTITAGFKFISPDKRVAQAVVGLSYLGFIAFYIWLSYYNIMEDERLVVFRGGRAIGSRGPGRFLLLPLIDNPRRVDIRERSIEIKKEPCITQDNVLVMAGFYMTWQIDEPIPSITRVSNIEDSMSLLAAAALRSAIAEFEMENAMERRRALNNMIRARIRIKAEEWGAQINLTEIRELQPSEGVMRQIESRLSARIESETTLERSNAKVRSLQDFLRIGEGMARNPIAFNLKYLDTLEKIGEGSATKYIIPMEFFNLLQETLRGQGNGNNPGNENNPPGLPGGFP